jgi:ribosomal protein S18 acetylase RimI-like enzyme
VPLAIRPAEARDDDAIWRILEPTFRAGETYPIPRDVTRANALAYWRTPGHAVFIAEDAHEIGGTYYLRANTLGGGAQANCGYIVAPEAARRGIARAMCDDSLARAREHAFTAAVQFRRRLQRACGAAVASLRL